jgi:hypothetical protein
MLKTGDRSRRRQLEIGVAQSAKSARGGLFREGARPPQSQAAE